MSLKVVFIHGGPGLNSNPEKNLISERFKESGLDIYFWNEPREFDTKDPYSHVKYDLINYITSFKEPVLLLAHSWGCRLVIDCINEIEENVMGACFISPALDFKTADRNICKLALEILENQNTSAPKIQTFLESESDDIDEKRFEALGEAFSSNFFAKNFVSEKNMQNYFQYFTNEDEIRIADMFAIRKSMALFPTVPPKKIHFPVTAIFGKLDPIFTKSSEICILEENFSHLRVIELDDQSHYSHIEKTDIIINAIKEII